MEFVSDVCFRIFDLCIFYANSKCSIALIKNIFTVKIVLTCFAFYIYLCYYLVKIKGREKGRKNVGIQGESSGSLKQVKKAITGSLDRTELYETYIAARSLMLKTSGFMKLA